MLALFLPPTCAVCGVVAGGLCRACATALPAAPRRPPPPGVERAAALAAHEGTARQVVAALKFHHHRDALNLLGRAMAGLVEHSPAAPDENVMHNFVPDVVVWAATTPARRRQRGADQAELLARSVAAALGRPCHGHLRRLRGAPQSGRNRASRLEGPRFEARGNVPANVLVVDDVWTTGTTLSAAAAALRLAGAARVDAVTVTARP